MKPPASLNFAHSPDAKIPNSWRRPTKLEKLANPETIAFLSCPRNHGFRIVNPHHEVQSNGVIAPNLRCPAKLNGNISPDCDFRHPSVRLVGWNPLYCIAYQLQNEKGAVLSSHFQYTHAPDGGQARKSFLLSELTTNRRNKHAVIVAIGPVIGYHSDSNGENLTT